MKLSPESRRNLVGAAFLLPNIAGFLAFTLVPLLMSFAMAFSDWDIQRHNLFRDDPLRWAGLDNFVRLFTHPDFYRNFGNTLFLMMGLPVSIAGSLGAALLLTRAGSAPVGRRWALGGAGLVLVGSLVVLGLGGFSQQGLWLLLGTLAATVFLGGALTGGMVYRTMFYLPHFTAGVATYVLWKKLYNPQSGPINRGLAPVLDALGDWSLRFPALFTVVLPGVAAGLFLALGFWQVRRLRVRRAEGETGLIGWVVAALALGVAGGLTGWWVHGGAVFGVGAGVAILLAALALTWRRPASFVRRAVPADAGVGTELLLALGLVGILAALAGLALAARRLPTFAAAGLEPPDWLGGYAWAKPAIMLMAIWAAIGSNNMILYMAGLSNISTELYEAADIDGASRWQRFCHITWPQLAPITFFIVIMSVIHGLQGGFEMARTMTAGGPAGATTTLSYFIYTEGFETGRLGYASAVAWTLFAFVFSISLFNMKFGNRYVAD